MATKETKNYYLKDYQRFEDFAKKKYSKSDIDEKVVKSYFVAMGKRCQGSTLKRQLAAVRFGLKKNKIEVDLSEVSKYVMKKAA